jgi:hypothetical protein
MDVQGWWDELVAQLADPHSNREQVLECLRKILEGIEDGEPLPRHTEEE